MNSILKLNTVLLAASALLLGTTRSEAGSIARLVYDGVTGTTTASLTNAAIFPDQPTFREQLDDFSPTAAGVVVKGFQSKENTGSNFGSYVRGYLEAPATGAYTFYIASDDASELWLSTDVGAAGKRRIAFESTYGTPLFTGARISERASAPVSLVRGQKYYLEVLHKQGTGASYLQVGWQRPDGVQEVIPARHLYQHPLDPYLGRLEPNLAPTFNTSGLNGGDLPAEIAASEGEDVLVELDVLAAQPVTIQWRLNGATLAGENLSFLKLSRVSAALNGKTLQATVSNAYGQLTSASARLAITPDRAAPSVALVDHRGNPNQLTVVFSEPVTAASATNLANYELKTSVGASLPIQTATVLADGTTVWLGGVFNFSVDGNYLLTVRNIDDQAATSNRLSPNPTAVAVVFKGDHLGPIGFDPAHPLQDVTVVENRTAHFVAALTGAQPWRYQWSRNGSAIPGATNATLDLVAGAANAGAFQVVVSNEFSVATSPSFRLTVAPDTEPAKIASARGFAGLNRVKLTFDEPLTPASATNVTNYGIDSAQVLSASLSSDGRSVSLVTSPLQRGTAYLVSVIGLQDISVAGNLLNATASFVAEVDYAGEVIADNPVRYWRFDETEGGTVASLTAGLDALSVGVGTLVGAPTLGVPGLLPSAPEDTAIAFSAASSQRVTVPNGSDLNANVGPWAKRTVEFWFRAASAPASDATGLAATAGIWEEGAATRSIAAYLWRDPAKVNPNEAELVFHAFDNAQDGPGSPFGIKTLPAVLVQHTVSVGQTYHVVAVFDGDPAGVTGNLILYVNGVEVGRAGGVGQIYNHTGDVQIGRGNGLIHTGENGDLGFFDGVLDEISFYNTALTAARVTAHYQAGLGGAGGVVLPPTLSRVDTRGNPNLVLATFSKPLAAASAAAPNFILKTASGTTLPISTATLLPGDLTVQLTGAFNFQVGAGYTLVAKDVVERDSPQGTITPNPTSVAFAFTTSGAVGIGAGSDLGSRKGYENQVVRFGIVPSGTGPFRYQWYRNGVALPGQTASELVVTATAATVGDYTVKASNDFSQITSVPATLSLDLDSAPPRLVAIRAIAGAVNQVRATFNEPLDPVSATNTSTYGLGTLPVSSAVLGSSGLDVTLGVGPLQNGQTYTLAIKSLKDRAAAANALTTNILFAAATSYRDEVLLDDPVRYWRFDETTGATAATAVAKLDAIDASAASFVNSPRLGVPGLVSNLVGNVAVQLSATNSQRLTVPNGSDLNANVGPWAKRTVQFWFRANTVPAPDTTGLASVAGIWEEGGANRSIAVYLWRDPANGNPDEAELVLHAVDNVADGAGSPYGPPADAAVYAHATITAGRVYHVVAVFDGDAAGLNGDLVLYLNGAEAARANGIGQIYNHTSDIQIGRGNAIDHNGDNGDFGFFDGVIDELSVFNTALGSSRVARLYQAANVVPPAFVGLDLAATDIGNKVSLAGQTVRFSVAATGAGPYGYQWYKDGVALSGETASSLQFTAAEAKAGSYSVVVNNAFSFVTSSAGALTVLTQSFPPEVVSVSAFAGSLREVRLGFSRPVEASSATDPANYNLGSLALSGITLSANGQTVSLHTGPQTPGAQVAVAIRGVRDRNTPDGVLTTNIYAQSRVSFPDEVLADGPVRYWRFEESTGTNVFSQVSVLDALTSAKASLYNGTRLGAAGLVPNQAGSTAIELVASNSNRLLVPNGSDINATVGPWAKRSFSLWFKANNLPRGGAAPQAPVIWEEGGDTRGLAIYLYGIQDTNNPTEALLVWNAYNSAADGVTGGWGVGLGNTTNAVFVTTPIRAGQTYHVVAVLDGDTTGKTGSIYLYVNGQLAGKASGAGQLFNHTSDIQIGRGAFVRHDGITAGNLHYLDGVIDDLAVFNKALTADRAARLYEYGLANPVGPSESRITSVTVRDGNIVIAWEGSGRLAVADNVAGPYAPVANQANPYSEPLATAHQRFFQVVP